jgi:hypothetical protein
MRRLALFALALFGCSAANAQATIDAAQGFCAQGAVPAVTSGLNSTNRLQGIVPSCKITVYLTGTQTLATIFSDAAGDTLSNPFTAVALGGVAPGQWTFYAADGVGYDVIGSGGIPPNTYAAPVTLCKDCKVGGSGGGGGSSITIQHNGVNVTNQTTLNFNDITPTAPITYINCTFQTDSAGDVSCYVPVYTPPTPPTPINPVQVTLPTSLISANTCTSPTTVTMTGVVAPAGSTPGTVFAAIPEGNPGAVNGWGSVGGLVMQLWVSAANTMSWQVCNQSGSGITPGALTVDVAPSSGNSGGGGGSGSVTSFTASSGSWPSWLVPTVTSSTTTPALTVAAGPIPNSALANNSITLGSTGVALGGTISSAPGLTAGTATALAGTPTLCSTGNAPTGILPNGNATGCAAIGGGGGGGGATLQVNSVNTLSQTLQNLTNTSTVLWTNTSGGVVQASVPTSAFSVLGVASPDNTSILAATGVYSIKSPGASTILGFSLGNLYVGYTPGAGISFAGNQITNTSTANAVMTGLSSGQIPEATGATTLGPSGLSVLSGSTIIGSGTSANVDGWGELAFSSSATETYTFANSYSVHPECVVTPQFSTANNWWVSYAGTTSFTINFSGTITSGNVSYVCFKRT